MPNSVLQRSTRGLCCVESRDRWPFYRQKPYRSRLYSNLYTAGCEDLMDPKFLVDPKEAWQAGLPESM